MRRRKSFPSLICTGAPEKAYASPGLLPISILRRSPKRPCEGIGRIVARLKTGRAISSKTHSTRSSEERSSFIFSASSLRGARLLSRSTVRTVRTAEQLASGESRSRGWRVHSRACSPSLWSPCRPVSYTHLRAHETRHDLVCRLLLEKKK